MSRMKTLGIAAIFCMALNLFGMLVLNFRPLTETELLLLVFISAWAGEQTKEEKGTGDE